MHLDLQVDDLDAAAAVAEEAGAVQIGGHEDDDEVVRVYARPGRAPVLPVPDHGPDESGRRAASAP